MKGKQLFILDVSGYIFRAYFALPPMSNSRGEATHALFGFIRSLLKLYKDFNPDHIVAVFDGPDNTRTRREIHEEYKAHRVRAYEDLPQQIEDAQVLCDLMGIAHVEVEGVEADDTMGSIAQWAAQQGAEVYLCTSDKDLAQLVNERIFLLNPWKENVILDSHKVEEVYGVPPHQIVDYLAIVGDTSDNIPGIKGFGPKTAIPLLKDFGSLEGVLAHIDQVAGTKKQETLRREGETARLSKRLATIQTDVEFPKDSSFFSKKQPKLSQLKSFYIDKNFNTLAREIDALFPQEENVTYHLVDTKSDLDALIARLMQATTIAFDLETTSVQPLLAEPVGIGFCIKEREAYYIPFNGSVGRAAVIQALTPLFANPALSFCAHNAKYDLHILANVGIDLSHLAFDTILASYLLNSASRRHSLDYLSLHYFSKVKIPIKDLIGSGKKEISMAEVPIPQVKTYCCEDVDYTFRLKNVLAKELEERSLTSLLIDLELPLSRILLSMERKGIFVDVEQLQAYSIEISQDIQEVEQEIYALAGEEFNINSPKQLSTILYEKLGIPPLKKTATGLSTRAEILEILAIKHPIAEKLLTFRLLDKLRSTYIDALPLQVHPKTHRIHPTFSQFITATGRLSCQDPNLQNIPVRSPQGKRIRKAFRPEQKGWSFVGADYSQIELRLLAHLSEDPSLIALFQAGGDVHRLTASLIFDTPLAAVNPHQRHSAKAINFGIIYGQQAYGLSQELGIDIKEAGAFIDAYFTRYPHVRAFMEDSILMAREHSKVVTMTGRERSLPDIHSSNTTIRHAAERLAINTPLQGSAADLIKLAMLKIDTQMKEKSLSSAMILQIHDELVFEVPDEELDTLVPLVKSAMENVFTLKVPLLVDVNIGKNWANI